MYGIYHIRPVSVGLNSQIWYLFIHVTGYLNVRKVSEMIDFRTLVGPLVCTFLAFFDPYPPLYALCTQWADPLHKVCTPFC